MYQTIKIVLKKNVNQQIHVNAKKEIMSCYSLFIEDLFLSLASSFIML